MPASVAGISVLAQRHHSPPRLSVNNN